jgi:ammonium transporter, Amt family
VNERRDPTDQYRKYRVYAALREPRHSDDAWARFFWGLVQRKNVLTIMMQSFMSLGWTTVIWFAFGYSESFGPTWHGIIGNPTTYAFLRGVTLHAMFASNAGLPLVVHIAYQMMFAIITPALITGASANRVTFKAYFWFLTFWLIFVYFPFVHMLWSPNGILAKWGCLDFAGGIVVHASAGFAALASVLYVGRRRLVDNRPHNVPLIALGTGLLWFGWYGFNAGSELRVDAVTASAFLNTDIAASFAAVARLFVEWIRGRQPKFVGLLTGAVAGLATITPAAGFVSPMTAVIFGLAAGTVCYFGVALKNRFGWDDALDVWGVHGVGGFLGICLLGVFASTLWNPNGADGLLRGSPAFLGSNSRQHSCAAPGPLCSPTRRCISSTSWRVLRSTKPPKSARSTSSSMARKPTWASEVKC